MTLIFFPTADRSGLQNTHILSTYIQLETESKLVNCNKSYSLTKFHAFNQINTIFA